MSREIIVSFVGNDAIYIDSKYPFMGKIDIINDNHFIIFEEEALKLASEAETPTLPKISLFERAFRRKSKSTFLYVGSEFLIEAINQRTNATMKRLCKMLNRKAIKKLKNEYCHSDSTVSWEVWLLERVTKMTAEERCLAIDERG